MATVILASLIVATRPTVLRPFRDRLEKPELLFRICLICSIFLGVAVVAMPQTRSPSQHRVRKPASKPQPKEQPTPAVTPESVTEPVAEPSPVESQPEDQQGVETLKIDTNLVTVPVIATTRDGIYISDLRQHVPTVIDEVRRVLA